MGITLNKLSSGDICFAEFRCAEKYYTLGGPRYVEECLDAWFAIPFVRE
jgi:hypothetical protein